MPPHTHTEVVHDELLEVLPILLGLFLEALQLLHFPATPHVALYAGSQEGGHAGMSWCCTRAQRIILAHNEYPGSPVPLEVSSQSQLGPGFPLLRPAGTA